MIGQKKDVGMTKHLKNDTNKENIFGPSKIIFLRNEIIFLNIWKKKFQ